MKIEMKDDTNNKFNSINEFIDNLSRGGEIEFLFNNKKYSITHIHEKICVSEQYNDSSEKFYDNPTDAVEYVIDGYKLKDIITKIEPFFRCF